MRGAKSNPTDVMFHTEPQSHRGSQRHIQSILCAISVPLRLCVKFQVDSKYTDTCFVTARDHTNYIPAHEILHLLGLEHTLLQPWNLMRKDFPRDDDYLLKDLRSWKRLTGWQVKAIHDELEKRKKGNQ